MTGEWPETHRGSGSIDPFVSIVIPTFNGGQWLERVIKNCLAIQGIDLEILLVDDGSTDGTPERIKAKFPVITLYQLHPNSGSGSKGRNHGLAMAKGRYVKFLDHDDLIQPRGFKAECEEALRSDADIIMSRWGVVGIDDGGCFERDQLRIFTPPDPGRLIDAILLGESTPFTAAVLYKRQFLGHDQWDAKATMIDDFDWFCRMVMKGAKITSVEHISYYWCLHPFSIQGRSQRDASIYQKLTFACCRTYQKIEDSLQDSDQLTVPRKRMLARRYYDFLRCLARYDARQCYRILARIKHLDPVFCVDSSCEPDVRSRELIHAFGLPTFLIVYGMWQRLSDAGSQLRGAVRPLLSSLRRPPIRVRDRE